MKLKSTKSIVGLIKKAKGQQSKRRSKKGGDDTGAEDLAELMRLQREAVQLEMENAEGLIQKSMAAVKGLQKARDIQEEYKTAKSGVQSRYGNIAKAFGLTDAKGAKMLDQLFGKKVDDAELKKMREKFKIGEKEEKSKAAKTKKTEESVARSKRRDEQLANIEDLSNKIFNILGGMKASVDGVANKLRASPARETPKSSNQMRKLEKQAGLKYSKEKNRYRDIKSGKFVGAETARQRMNLATKVATPVAAATGGLASKVIADTPKKDNSLQNLEDKVDKVAKDTKDTKKQVEEILDMFSLKKFYALIGGAVGFAFPLLKRAVEWIGNLAQSGWAWVKDVASKVGDWLSETLLKLEFTIPGVEVFGRKLWDSIHVQPFSFLKKKETAKGAPPTEGEKKTPTPAAAPSAPAPAGGAPAPAAPKPAAPAPTPAAAPLPEGKPSGGRGGARNPQTATPQGGNMPGAAPPPAKPAGGGGDSLALAADFITKEEGLPKGGKAYWDPPGQNNLVAVGYGHQIKDEEYNQGFIQAGGEKIPLAGTRGIDTVLSKEQAKALLAIDLKKYEERAAKPLGDAWSKLNANQKASLISYAYNTGSTRSLVKVGLKDAAAAGDVAGGANIISEKGIKTAGGQLHAGLAERRKREGSMYASTTMMAEAGGLAIGPKSGYGATLHGKEAIIPLNAQTHASKQAVAAVSKAVSGEDMKNQTADNKSAGNAPSVVPVPIGGGGSGGGKSAQQQKPDNSMKASVRHQDSAFARALAQDFVHPSAFSSVSPV